MPVESIGSIAQNPTWLDKELHKLRGQTVLLFMFSLFFCGLILGYFLLGNIFLNYTSPIKNVTHAYVGDSNLNVTVETKEPTMAKIEYGTSEEVLNERDIDNSYQTNHNITIEGLLPEKPHTFRLVLNDADGKEHKSTFYVTE